MFDGAFYQNGAYPVENPKSAFMFADLDQKFKLTLNWVRSLKANFEKNQIMKTIEN